MGLTAIILAAGQGTRMRSDMPKVLQPLAGRPLLGHVLDCAAALSADDVCVVYGHGGEAVREAFPYPGLRWALQAEQLGTGHAVQQAMPETPGGNRVLILFGDVPLLTPATCRRLIDGTPQGDVAVTSDLMDGGLSVIDLASAEVTDSIAVSSPDEVQERFQVTMIISVSNKNVALMRKSQ